MDAKDVYKRIFSFLSHLKVIGLEACKEPEILPLKKKLLVEKSHAKFYDEIRRYCNLGLKCNKNIL
jgi:hypothetical protein